MFKYIFIALSLATSPAFAGNCDIEPDYENMVKCYSSNSQAIDKDLNTAYQSALKISKLKDNLEYSPHAYEFIKQNQRDWLKYSQGYCDAKSKSSNEPTGSFYSTAASMCFSDLSIRRIQELKQLECEEGDMSSTCIFYK